MVLVVAVDVMDKVMVVEMLMTGIGSVMRVGWEWFC